MFNANYKAPNAISTVWQKELTFLLAILLAISAQD